MSPTFIYSLHYAIVEHPAAVKPRFAAWVDRTLISEKRSKKHAMLTFFAWHELSCVSIGHVWPFVSFLRWNLEKTSIRMHHMSEVRTPAKEYDVGTS